MRPFWTGLDARTNRVRNAFMFRTLGAWAVASLLTSSPVWAEEPPKTGSEKGLGTKDPGLLNLKGTIYALDDGTEGMPADLDKRKPIGTVFSDCLDVPNRSFTEGFPGVTNRFEWFGLLYTGTFQVKTAGSHTFRLNSDDGSRLWIDGQPVIDNDGVHGENSVEGTTKLTAGTHTMKVWYFQGPATEVALQLFVTPPGQEERIFKLSDFSAGLSGALSKVKAEASDGGIKVQLDASVLFASGKFDLGPKAADSLSATLEVIKSYPGSKVTITGHTDSVGVAKDNEVLSLNRAQAVKAFFEKAGMPKDVVVTTSGMGAGQPIADNKTDAGRAKNRRVEVLIIP